MFVFCLIWGGGGGGGHIAGTFSSKILHFYFIFFIKKIKSSTHKGRLLSRILVAIIFSHGVQLFFSLLCAALCS